MGESLDLLAEAISMERFDRVHDSRVKLAPTLPQQSFVGDVVRERMRE